MPIFTQEELEQLGSGTTPTEITPQSNNLLFSEDDLAYLRGAPAEGQDDPAGLIEALPLPNSVKRGMIRSTDVPTAIGTMLDIVDPETHAKQVARSMQRLQKLPMSDKQQKGVEEILDYQGFGESVLDLVSNPSAALALVGESLGAMIPSTILGGGAIAGMAMTGGAPLWMTTVAGALGFGAGSGLTEAASSLTESLTKEGVDVTDPLAVQDMLEDDMFLNAARERATKRGLPVGAFDTLTFGLSTLPYKAVVGALGKTGLGAKATVAAGSVAEAGVQAGGGASGEALAQRLTGEHDPGQVFLEGALEVATAGPQAIIKTAMTKPSDLDLKLGNKKDVEKAFAEEVITTAKEQGELFQNLPHIEKEDTKAPGIRTSIPRPVVTQPDLFDPELDQRVSLQAANIPTPKPDKLGFYSQLEDALDKSLPNKGTGPTYNDVINAFQRRGLFTREELAYSGLEEFLADKPRITKQEVLDFVRNGGVEIQEVVDKGPTYLSYSLEGADTKWYTTTLLKLPESNIEEENFFGDHWDAGNVLAHFRTSDKTVDGKSTLFVEEVQSDWHQDGLLFGYEGDARNFEGSLSKEKIEWGAAYGDAEGTEGEVLAYTGKNGEKVSIYTRPHDGLLGLLAQRADGSRIVNFGTVRLSKNELLKRYFERQKPADKKHIAKALGDPLPQGPFKKTWTDLAVKRILKQAAEQGYDAVAFPTSGTAAKLIQGHYETAKGMVDSYDTKIPNAVRKAGNLFGLDVRPSTYTFNSPIDNFETTAKINVVDLSPEIRDQINGKGFTRHQGLPGGPNSLEAQIDWTPTADMGKVADNLYGMRLTPEAEAQFAPIKKEIKSLVKQLTGKDIHLDYFDTLIQKNPDAPHQYVRGAQFADTVAISLGLNDREGFDTLETMFHETWHFLENSGAFDDADVQILEEFTPKLAKLMQKDLGMSDDQIAYMLSTPRGREEFRAHGFGTYGAARLKKEKNFSKNVPQILRPLFDRAYKVLTAFSTPFKRRGVTTANDLFAEAYEGRRRSRHAADLDRTARLQEVVTGFNQAVMNNEMSSDKMFKDIDEAIKKENDMKDISTFARFIGSPMFMGVSHPAIQKVVSFIRERSQQSNFYLSKYQKILRDFDTAPREVRYRAYDLMNYLRETEQKAELDEAGRLIFNRGEKRVVVTDVGVSKMIMDVQEAYREVRKDALEGFRRAVRKSFRKLGSDFTKEDLEALQTTENAEQVEDALNRLEEFEKMDRHAYVPHTRFGKYGIAVFSKEEVDENGEPKLVGFYRIEGGKYKDKYSKFSVDETIERIKAKGFDDTSKYSIVGDNRKKIKDIDNIDSWRPYLVNKTAKLNAVSSDLTSLDNLFSLYGKDDSKLFTSMREDLMTNKHYKGFGKVFSESKGIAGESLDWDRVHAAYFHGASNYLANLDFLPKTTYLRSALGDKDNPNVGGLENDNTKAWIHKHLDYLENPHEDFSKLKMFNFMWTLGFNASTAAIQTASLFTHGLGYVTSLSGNPVGAMRDVGKWFNRAGLMTKDGFDLRQASVNIDFGNAKSWKRLEKTLKWGKDELARFKQLVELLDSRNLLGGLMTAEHQGLQTFETRGKAGKIKRSANIIGTAAGIGISTTEQMTRMAVLGSLYETLVKNPEALGRAQTLLSGDKMYQAALERDSGTLDDAQVTAAYLMERAMAVFGKEGRAPYMRGWSGAIPFAFMTYPHQMWENMALMAKTKEGRQGLMVTLGAYMALGGLMGLPGGEFLKELYERLYTLVDGDELDLDLAIRQKLAEATGEPKIGLAITQGIPRAAGVVQLSRRTGTPVPGQELVFLLTGVRTGEAADMLGVPGTALSGFWRAQEKIREEGSLMGALGETLPTAMANLVKGISYQDGITSRSGTGILSAEDVTTWDKSSRMLGFTSAHQANMRERAFYEILLNNKHKPAYNRFRERAKNHMAKYLAESKAGNAGKAEEAYKDFNKVLVELTEWAKKKGYPLDIGSFSTSVTDSAVQRLNPKALHLKGVRKAARKEVSELNQALGIEE